MTRTIVLLIAALALAAFAAGCGQQEEMSATAEMSADVQTAEIQTVSAGMVDPVCGMKIDPGTAVMAEYEGETYYFCSAQCQEQFQQDPAKYMAKKELIDPVCGMKVDPKTAIKGEYEGQMYQFCSAECHDTFMKDPGKYMSSEGHHMEGMEHEGHGH